jgi:DNA-binding MurR/RpiR family transcriptional regulator
MKPDLFAKLEARMESFTPAERQIAHYILTNRAGIPFETAASLATKLGVSAVTVGRFCRALGYRHFRDLKEDLRTRAGAMPWLVGDQLKRFMDRYDDEAQLRRSLELEMAALVEVYDMVTTPQWKAAVTQVVSATTVQIAGFQTERGLAHLFAHSLQYVRDGVELVDTASGHYAEIFARRIKQRCLILIDIKRYSRQSYLLAEMAAAEGVPLVIITDKHCDWGRRYAQHVLAVPSESGQFWSSSVAMTCLINLFVNAIVARSGKSVERHLERVSQLFAHFTGFVNPGSGRTGRAASSLR